MSDFDIEKFRKQFPVFQDETKYPDEMILLQVELAKGFLAKGCNLNGSSYDAALSLMVAHLMWINYLLSQGQTVVGVTVGATIDKVSVSIAPPPTKTGWQYWLMSTPYGAQLYAFLMMRSAGGWYIGGTSEASGFRGLAGRFGRGRRF